MPKDKTSAERVRRKRERDRTAGLVRVDERVPSECVDEFRSIAADMRNRRINKQQRKEETS